MGMPAVQVKQINKTFGEGENRTQVLFDIDLAIPSGGIFLIVGPSGCGKTTLISIIAGILKADHGGQIEIFDHTLHTMSDSQKADFRQANLGFIFQQFNLVNTLTLLENVAIPLLIQGQPQKQAFARARSLLEEVGLEQKIAAFPLDLSGGQQQRVAIARALVNDPKVVICDEPTSSLDGQSGQKVMELMQGIASRPNRCVIIVSHDNRIYNFADQIIEMEDGRIKQIYNKTERPGNEAS